MKLCILLLTIGLSGCAAIDKRFESNIMVDLRGANAVVDSRWVWFGITAKLSPDSQAEIERLIKADRARQEAK